MSPLLIAAASAIVVASVLYTLAVWREHRAGALNAAHLALFWSGLIFDTLGTSMMSEIAGGWERDVHGAIGAVAIVLMLVHSVWASVALGLRKDSVLRDFHKFSLAVWALWMVAFVSGFVFVGLRMSGLL